MDKEKALRGVERWIETNPGMGLGKYLCKWLGVCDTYLAKLTDTEVMQYMFGERTPRNL